MIARTTSIALYRLIFGLLGLSAIATEVVVLLQRGTFMPANFFSFFTIQSNLMAAFVLVTGGVLLLCRKPGLPILVRGAATLYMLVTGIIFALLLSGLDAGVLTAVPWDNTVLHYLMPLAVLGDWLLDPPKQRIAFRRAAVWLLYPVVYLVYTLIRGHFVGWYPYPFLHASNRGYIAVVLTSVGVAAVIVCLAWLVATRQALIRKR